MYADVDSSGTLNNAETVLRRQVTWPSTDTFSANPNATSITFSRDGFTNLPLGAGAGILMTMNTTPASANARRCVQLNRLGHQSVVPGGTGGCT